MVILVVFYESWKKEKRIRVKENTIDYSLNPLSGIGVQSCFNSDLQRLAVLY